jgi:hypothetical protein
MTTHNPATQTMWTTDCMVCDNERREFQKSNGAGLAALSSRMILCADCGNKRCPKATDHRNACTGSNEPGQEGSYYQAVPFQTS